MMRRIGLVKVVAVGVMLLYGVYGEEQAPATQTPKQSSSTPLTEVSPKDILGIWQGTLHVPRIDSDMQIEIRITPGVADEYKTTLYRIDQGGRLLVTSKTTFVNGTLTFTMEMIGGKFVGAMGADGKTITGTWTQGPNPLPLVLGRTTEDAAWPIPEPPKPMAAEANPEFEVATIKPSDPARCCARTFGSNDRRFRTTNTNLKYLIQWAWNLQAKQVAGGPAWMDADRFDVAGEIDGDGVPNNHQWKVAVQRLLTERFKLQMHDEKREMLAFALVVAKGGPKLAPGDRNMADQRMGFSGGVGKTMHGEGVNASIGDFIGELQRIVMDRPIIDQTGLTGVYNVSIAFTREEPGAIGMAQLPDTAAPNLFEALEQQLGLKLASVKAPVDVIVVDHAEAPGEN